MLNLATFHHPGVVGIGHDTARGMEAFGVADHGEHRLRLTLAIDGEIGIEDLVAAVFAVGLGEHHQLDITRVASQAGEGGGDVIDLVIAEGKTEGGIGVLERHPALGPQRHMGKRWWRQGIEEVGRCVARERHGFGHTVVQQRGTGVAVSGRQRAATGVQPIFDDALKAMQRQPAVVGDVGGLARPGGHGAQPWHDDDEITGQITTAGITVVEQGRHPRDLVRAWLAIKGRPVDAAGRHRRDARALLLQALKQRPGAERGQSVASLEVPDGEGRGSHAVPERAADQSSILAVTSWPTGGAGS